MKFSASCQESDSYSDYIGGFYCCDCYFNFEVVYLFYFTVMFLFYD